MLTQNDAIHRPSRRLDKEKAEFFKVSKEAVPVSTRSRVKSVLVLDPATATQRCHLEPFPPPSLPFPIRVPLPYPATATRRCHLEPLSLGVIDPWTHCRPAPAPRPAHRACTSS